MDFKIFIFIFLLYSCGNPVSQSTDQNSSRLVGGPCEGCEGIFEYDDRDLNSIDTLPDFNNKGTKIKITGTIYKKDEKTPAEGVLSFLSDGRVTKSSVSCFFLRTFFLFSMRFYQFGK